MTLVGSKPRVTSSVFLNEDLEFVFSHAPDPATVTQHTFRVVDQEGNVAAGRWSVSGRTLSFHPASVLRDDLSGGGYRPSTRYSVELVGFPSLSSIASIEGWPLDRSRRFEFETVQVAGERRGVVFDDASPGSAAPVHLATALGRSSRTGAWQLEADDALVLSCAEPLDPSTLVAENYWLRCRDETVLAGRIPVTARFTANYDEGEAPYGEPAAVIELLPSRYLPPGLYDFVVARDAELRDFGGNPVWRMGVGAAVERLEVVLPNADPSVEEATDLTIEFVRQDRHLLTLLSPPESDGTLTWEAGRATVRYPRAAGDGSHGPQELGAGWPNPGWSGGDGLDLHATRVSLSAGETVALEQSGLVVLRAQGSFTIDGELRRRTPAPGCPEVVANPLKRPAPTLTSWLEQLGAEGQAWTVLVAGGDLTLGERAVIDVDTPLLLVVGGQIRLHSRARLIVPRSACGSPKAEPATSSRRCSPSATRSSAPASPPT